MFCKSFVAVIAVMLAGAFPASTHGQTKAKQAQVDEKLFALYALEDFPRKFKFGDPQDAAAVGTPAPVFTSRFMQLRSTAAHQQVLYDTLRRHVQKRGDKELLEIVQSYGVHLEVVNNCIKAVDQMAARTSRTVNGFKTAASANVLMSGLTYGLRAYCRWG